MGMLNDRKANGFEMESAARASVGRRARDWVAWANGDQPQRAFDRRFDKLEHAFNRFQNTDPGRVITRLVLGIGSLVAIAELLDLLGLLPVALERLGLADDSSAGGHQVAIVVLMLVLLAGAFASLAFDRLKARDPDHRLVRWWQALRTRFEA